MDWTTDPLSCILFKDGLILGPMLILILLLLCEFKYQSDISISGNINTYFAMIPENIKGYEMKAG